MLDVIGVGLGRTGTMSLKHALEHLLDAPCYHMIETVHHPEHDARWLRALEGGPVDWDAIYRGYRAAVAWPTVTFWREVLEAYPRAKAVLTVRDPDVWYRSVSNTVIPVVTSPADADGHASAEHRRMTQEAILERTFRGQYGRREDLLACYDRHYAEVQAAVPADRLLIYDVAEGWAPLCTFLGLPVPDAPYPHRNTTAEFQDTHFSESQRLPS